MILLQLGALLAVFVCTWRLLFLSQAFAKYHRMVRQALGFAVGCTSFLVAVLFLAWHADWLIYATAAALVLATHRQNKKTPPTVTPTPAPIITSGPSSDEIFRHRMPEPPNHFQGTRTLDEWNADNRTIWSGSTVLLTFSYEDASGNTSRRSVDVDEICEGQDGDLYLCGFCHKRNDRRAFRADRITSKISDGTRRWEPYEWLAMVTGREL